ncbi:hypothetical protein [Burkholderia gladioli]|uniref:hypothetical protein n=1 Tax=Burkholderia gladioli TaxID=28095 RepID=UPI00164167D0|nr:hypothetical protein [Burkholderia gladioli]
MKKLVFAFAISVVVGSAFGQSLGDALGNYRAQMQSDVADKFCDEMKKFGGLAAQANSKNMSRYKVKDAVSRSIAQQPGFSPAQRPVVTHLVLGMVDDIYIQRITDEGDGIAEGRNYCMEQMQDGM